MSETTWTQDAGMSSPTEADNVENYSEQAEASKDAAAASATAAAASATAAAGSEATATAKATESATSAAASATSASASEVSNVASGVAETASEAAKVAAETAKTASETAKTAAETAKVAAETAETNAAASEAAALSSKNAAATSASTSSTKATESATSATASEVSNVAAGVAKVAAETAETNAETAQTASETAKTASEAAKVAAETAETNASASATTATAQAGIATTKAGEAAASATASASSATASEAAKDAALAALDNFDDRYLGAKASDPTVDNDGNALVSGALYFNSTTDSMKVYEGSSWVAAYASLSGALLATNNLSDLASASAGRTNLGLGTAATTASTDYATAAQGALAASATQPGDLATVATSGAYSDLSGTPSPFDPSTLATVATSGSYSDLSGTPALGTAATSAATDFVAVTGDSMTGDLSFGDNDKAIFGAGSDLQIYHNGSASVIKDAGAGDLYIAGSSAVKITNDAINEDLAVFNHNGSVDLYYDSSKKLATTSTGIDVSGEISADGLTVDVLDAEFALGSDANARGELRYNYSLGDLTLENTWANDAGEIFIRAGGALRQQVSGNGDISFYEDTGTTPKFFWDASAESLGIGTSSPSAPLHLNGGSENVVLKATNSSNTSGLFVGARDGTFGSIFSAGDGYIYQGGGENLSMTADGGGVVRFGTGSTERMRLDSSGRVGIGTTSPSYRLDVDATNSALRVYSTNTAQINIQSGDANDAKIEFGDASDNDRGSIAYDNPNNALKFVTNTSERMRLDSSGNLLVGTTSSFGSSGITLGSNNVVYAAASSQNVANFQRYTTDGEIVRLGKDGTTVGSIAVAPSALEISSGNVGLFFNPGGGNIFPSSGLTGQDNAIDLGRSLFRFKDAYFSGTVNAANFNTTSDATLKTNVETLSGSLDAVKSLRGVSFDWLENGGSEIGVIAQEVEAVLPDVVSTNDEGIKSVKYGNMVALLIEAMKEQQLRIEALEAQLGE